MNENELTITPIFRVEFFTFSTSCQRLDDFLAGMGVRVDKYNHEGFDSFVANLNTDQIDQLNKFLNRIS